MNTRIYAVENGNETRLVRAASATQAVKHTTKHITAEVVAIERYGELLLSGVKVEDVARDVVTPAAAS